MIASFTRIHTTQVGTVKTFLVLTTGLTILLSCDLAYSQDQKASAPVSQRVKYRYLQSRPRRLDVPLREENISDEEVREIEAVTKGFFPGAIVNISGVTTGCPCEDGPQCTSQVWVVAYRGERNNGLALSRIDDKWKVGLLQQWWIHYDKLHRRMREIRISRNPGVLEKLKNLWEEQQRLQDVFPVCASED